MLLSKWHVKKVDAENEQLLEYKAALPQLEAEHDRMVPPLMGAKFKPH